MRVALVHECVAGYHGSERVLSALSSIWPDAPIFTMLHDERVLAGTGLSGKALRGSVLQGLPGALRRRHRWLLPLMPYAVEQHDLRGFDVVISSHHAAAHGVLTRSDQLHVSYTHSPARYAWDLYAEHVDPGSWSPMKRWLLHRFRRWDQLAAARVDWFFANSEHVSRRIARAYRRAAEVVHPPVSVDRFSVGGEVEAEDRSGYVALGRLVGYKRTALVVEAFTRMGKRLTVVGDGPEWGRLRGLAGPSVSFVRDADESAVAVFLRGARGLVFAGEEDFGITLVEALASGTPVLAWDRGGAREIVADGLTGVLFGESSVAGVVGAVERFEREGVSGSADMLVGLAERFSEARFSETMERRVGALWERFGSEGPRGLWPG